MKIGQRHKGRIETQINPKIIYMIGYAYFTAWFGAYTGSQYTVTEPRYGFIGGMACPFFDYGEEIKNDLWLSGTPVSPKEWNNL